MRSDAVNAFALPGGIVVITEQLLVQASGPDEVAGVLAHELEHVRRRHVLTHFVRATLLSGAWSLAVGDYAGLMVIDPSTAFDIANLRFSRDEEAEADAAAGAQLDRAGISRRGLYDFFQRLRHETDDLPAWLSNHPSSESRAHQLGPGSSRAEDTSPALDAATFDALRAACQR
jgi:predicted Zn-dependent protease